MVITGELRTLKIESERRSELLKGKVLIRKIRENDEAFIYHSWLTTFRNAEFVSGVRKSRYFPRHHKIIENLLFKSEVRIACNREDEDHVYGWMVYEINPKVDLSILHFIYVKAPFRGLGIGAMLFEPLKNQGLYVSHLAQKDVEYCDECNKARIKNQYGKNLIKKIGATYDPYLIWEGK